MRPATRYLALLTLSFTGGACAAVPDDEAPNPNEGLLRDFLDGKFDAAGHPLNAKIVEAEDVCSGSTSDGGIRLRGACDLGVPSGAQSGELMVNVRLRVREHARRGAVVTVSLVDANGAELVSDTLTVSRLRGRSQWIDLPVTLSSGTADKVRITPAAGAAIDVDYAEIFPRRLGLVIAPGSGIFGDDDRLTFELPKARKLDRLEADGLDLLPKLQQLVSSGAATKTTTAFRTIFDVRVADLLPDRGDVTELHARGADDAARIQLRRAPADCDFEGSGAKKVLVTGFHPFPADGSHPNVSAEAIGAMRPSVLRGARVMRLVLPVEYDRAPAAVAEVIDRCAPDIVISFGQGGSAIALERTAYNLQDTGEISGGAPDNRGIIRAAAQIDEAAPAERSTLLPLDAIEAALVDAGEAPQFSTDPGRYICNNTMFVNIATMGPRGGRAGFIHLPFTTRFDDDVRARFGRVVETAIQATVDAP